MKLVEYQGYQITTELYMKGFTWTYRKAGREGSTQQPSLKDDPIARYKAYPTREEAIEACKKEIDQIIQERT